MRDRITEVESIGCFGSIVSQLERIHQESILLENQIIDHPSLIFIQLDFSRFNLLIEFRMMVRAG